MTNYILLTFLYDKRNDLFLKQSDPPREQASCDARKSRIFQNFSTLLHRFGCLSENRHLPPSFKELNSFPYRAASNSANTQYTQRARSGVSAVCGRWKRAPASRKPQEPGGDARERRWTAASRTTTKRGGTIQEGGPPRPPKFFSLSPFVSARVLALPPSSFSRSLVRLASFTR